MRTKAVSLAGVIACCLCSSASAADWLQWGYDPSHSADNPDETTIGAANVAQLTRRYQVTMSANANVAPVLARAIDTPGGNKDLLFVTAQNGRLTAYDAFDGSVVWSANTTGTAPTESAPAIDPNRQFVYGYGIDGKVHKYRIGDGVETTDGGWPQVATLKPNVEKGASALSFAVSGGKTYLYMVNDGYIGDGGDYQGHLTAIDLATGTQKVFNTLCSDIEIHMVPNGTPGTTGCSERQSGIWGRPGATYDAVTDRIYITTGNGLFDAHTGGLNWGDSVLALKPDGSGRGAGLPMDSYTPTNYNQLDGQDIDLGSASLSILPVPAASTVQHLGLQTGKDAKLRLIDLDDMSGTGAPGGVGGEIQLIDVPVSEFWMKTQPAVWVDRNGDGATWVFMANGSGLSGLKLVLDAANKPYLQSTWTKSGSGATGATSAIIANDVVYHAGSCSGGNCLYARNPHTGDVLWTSPTIGSLKWQSPILINGALYVAAGTKLNRFDLGETGTTHVVTPSAGPNGHLTPGTPQTVDDGATTSFAVTPDTHYRIDSVTGCGGTLDGTSYTTGPISADCTVEASFAIITHTVTPEFTAGGSVVPATAQTVDDGAATSFTITPDNPGIAFEASGCGGALDGNVYTTAAVTADCTVTITFSGDDWIFADGFELPQ
ncbi:PQQ-binding-like beta-propeller repeat protein [Dokdonella sp.]|uniref:outer membrane protein assembly factor BamB family protein n=1 Tax=Dokdonella sp. TaxID=2291710 RepID=UPI001B1F9F32|nr:PQQ-binding-like beta-propeller repeat protein [Dokdonella sp.]MBO9661293.1 PQQ-binding-like beta-propeller repeat protein [Dokdonella sp.]